jgi:putative oxidoreductase
MAKNGENKLGSWALAFLRVVLGIIFAYHGYVKLFVPGGFKGTVAFFGAIGLPAPAWAALVVAAVEFFGGLALLVGLMTRWASALLFVVMLVAVFKVHLANGFFVSAGGYEFALSLLGGLAVIYSVGAGNLAWGNSFKNSNLK